MTLGYLEVNGDHRVGSYSSVTGPRAIFLAHRCRRRGVHPIINAPSVCFSAQTGKHLRSAGRPARSRECKSLTMKE
jgi:hypothetical protein